MHALLVIPYGVIPRGGDGSKGPGNPECQRQKEKIALFLGRVHPKKRPDILIQAWSEARIESDWKLVIAGPGEPSYLRHLAELARRGGVEGAVEFAGPVAGARKQELFSSASWFLLPSEQENFGIAVLEAVAGGCAVAVSDQVYLADEFPEGSEILPVRQDAWTGFMRKRMRDSAWRDETARRGQAKLLDRFSAERVSRGWVDSIRSVLSGCADQSTAATK
jgi:glycosyltransferase involved in cell wall biosynthesis